MATRPINYYPAALARIEADDMALMILRDDTMLIEERRYFEAVAGAHNAHIRLWESHCRIARVEAEIRRIQTGRRYREFHLRHGGY